MEYRFAFEGRGKGTAITLEFRSITVFSPFEHFKTKLLNVSAFLNSVGLLYHTRAPVYDKRLLKKNMFNFDFMGAVIGNFVLLYF